MQSTCTRPGLLLILICLLVLSSPLKADDRPELNIGSALKGAWVNAQMPGQGFLVEVIDEPAVLFIAWFTFPRPSEEPLTDPLQHRWYTIEGFHSSGPVEATIFQTSGGVFLDSMSVIQDPVGSASIRFFSCNEGQVDYQFEDTDEQGTIPIRRAIAVDESLCTDLAEPLTVPELVELDQASVFWDVSLLEMPSGITRNQQMVVVENGVITKVGSTNYKLVPEGAVVIDGRSRHLMPGLVDTHTHLATNVREFLGLNASPGVVELSAKNQLILYLARGVTSILNNGDFGEPLPRWGDEVIAGDLTGPHYLRCSVCPW